jgi:hypothetical protein
LLTSCVVSAISAGTSAGPGRRTQAWQRAWLARAEEPAVGAAVLPHASEAAAEVPRARAAEAAARRAPVQEAEVVVARQLLAAELAGQEQEPGVTADARAPGSP